jgi:hypothetical protein
MPASAMYLKTAYCIARGLVLQRAAGEVEFYAGGTYMHTKFTFGQTVLYKLAFASQARPVLPIAVYKQDNR